MTLRGLLLAVQFLTRLPTPQVTAYTSDDLRLVAPFVPFVGLIVGALLAIAVGLFGLAGGLVGAFCGVVAWVWVTGGLHLDGLGDVADAFGAAHGDPDRFLDVLRDPHAGSFAVIAIALVIAGKLALIAALPGSVQTLLTLLLVPAWARWGTLVWSLSVPPLRGGLGAGFAQGIDRRSVAIWGVALAGASVAAAPVLLVALVIVPLVTLWWRRALGGITGDCLGASVEVTEVLLLLAAVLAAAALR